MPLDDDLDIAKEAAGKVMDPRKVNDWLVKPKVELGGVTPIFLVRGGRLDEVLALLQGLVP